MWTSDSVQNKWGELLAVSIATPSKGAHGTLLMFPGFTSRRLNATNTRLAEALLPAGIRCVTCDLSGHGDSEGDIAEQTVAKAASEIGTLVDFVVKAWGADGSTIGILGNSFSGNAAILAAAADTRISALGLKSPVTDYVLMREHQLGAKAIAGWRRAGFIELPDGTRSNIGFLIDAERTDSYAALKAIEARVLAVFGSEDEEIPAESRARATQILLDMSKRVVVYEGADHNISDPFFVPMLHEFERFFVDSLVRSA